MKLFAKYNRINVVSTIIIFLLGSIAFALLLRYVIFTQIDEDLRSQYIMAYTPSNSARDGSFRAIQVRVKNQKDLNVRYRRGYYAPKA